MSFEEEFDKIIRQKSEEVEFPFNEKNWEQASAMIDSDRKAARLLKYKKFRKPLLAISIGLIGIIASVVYMDKVSKEESVIAEVQHSSQTEKRIAQSTPSASEISKIEVKSEINHHAEIKSEKQTKVISNPAKNAEISELTLMFHHEKDEYFFYSLFKFHCVYHLSIN